MSEASLLRTADGTLRAPWRLAMFAALLVAALLASAAAAAPLESGPGSMAGLLVFGTTMSALLLLIHRIALRWQPGTSWNWVGLGPAARRPRTLLLAALVGAASVGLPTGGLLLAGWLRPQTAAPGSSLAFAAGMTAMLAPAALWEELAFRGYAFAVLRDALGTAGALISTSIGFGALHLGNPGAGLGSAAMVALAGVFLGGVFVLTGSLVAAWLAHLAWNWTMAVVFHSAVSGAGFDPPDFRVVDSGPDWATGGAWGPEGGVLAGIGMMAGLAYLHARRARRGRDTA